MAVDVVGSWYWEVEDFLEKWREIFLYANFGKTKDTIFKVEYID